MSMSTWGPHRLPGDPTPERIVARYKFHHMFERPIGLEPDPSAPSVAEICRVLRQARGWVPQGPDHPTRQRITDLITRLEREL